jgi:hypothetical protein
MTTEPAGRVLEDPKNDLAEIVRAFKASGEACWHVDRHVFEASEAQQAQADFLIGACMVAVALARKWLEEASALRGAWLLISRPFAIIDDEWIAGVPGAAPPHAYVCLARDESAFEPVHHDEATPHASSGNPVLDSQLTARERLLRLEGALEGEPGAWIVELLDK